MFYKHRNGKVNVLIVYVDNIILPGDGKDKMKRLKQKLASEFEMMDLGNLRYFLVMEVARNRTGILVTQRKCMINLLKETGMLGCKPVDTLMDPNVKLGMTSSSNLVDKGRYQHLVDKSIYLFHSTNS